MKERPILFSAPMVRALLAGTKTQTRRGVKGNPGRILWNPIILNGYGGWCDEHGRPAPCPYSQPGDRLWVREAFRDARGAEVDRVLYRATGDVACGWKPSIHMPRDCSRILLDIVSIRVERLHDISEADSIAEGVSTIYTDGPRSDRGPNHYTVKVGDVSYNAPTAKGVYAMLWESINGPGSWEANPWVWVVEFKRVKP